VINGVKSILIDVGTKSVLVLVQEILYAFTQMLVIMSTLKIKKESTNHDIYCSMHFSITFNVSILEILKLYAYHKNCTLQHI